MNTALDADSMEARIQKAYDARLQCYPDAALGWRMFYSPRRVLNGARVAFIGFNPGGRSINPSHGQFSTEKGSAYRKEIEDWGSSSSLQDQVIALFQRLDIEPEDVLAGNLVPFRSPSEDSLPGASEAVTFGRSLWKEILDKARPSLVLSMGGTANREISSLLMVQNVQKYPIGWGQCTASRGVFTGGTWIGLPHLSRYGVMKRGSSQTALDNLFDNLD